MKISFSWRGQRVSNITLLLYLFQIVQEPLGNTFRVLNALYTCSSNVTMFETNGLTLLNYVYHLSRRKMNGVIYVHIPLQQAIQHLVFVDEMEKTFAIIN